MLATLYAAVRDFIKWLWVKRQPEFAGSGTIKIGASGKEKGYIYITVNNKGKISFTVTNIYMHYADNRERIPIIEINGLCDKLAKRIEPNKSATYCSPSNKFIVRLQKLNNNNHPTSDIFKKHIFEVHSTAGEFRIILENDFIDDLNSFKTDNTS